MSICLFTYVMNTHNNLLNIRHVYHRKFPLIQSNNTSRYYIKYIQLATKALHGKTCNLINFLNCSYYNLQLGSSNCGDWIEIYPRPPEIIDLLSSSLFQMYSNICFVLCVSSTDNSWHSLDKSHLFNQMLIMGVKMTVTMWYCSCFVENIMDECILIKKVSGNFEEIQFLD